MDLSKIDLSPTSLAAHDLRPVDPTVHCSRYLPDSAYQGARLAHEFPGFQEKASGLIPQLRRDVFKTHNLLMFASSTETHLAYAIFFGLVAAWAFSLYWRMAKKPHQRLMLVLIAYISLWMYLRTIKFYVTPPLETYIWYSYYICILGITCVVAILALSLKQHEHTLRFTPLILSIIAISCILCALVLTNNLHHLVYLPDETGRLDSAHYTYGPLYFVIIAWLLVVHLTATIIFAVASIRKLKPSWIAAIVTLFAITLIYGILYAKGNPLIIRTDHTLFYAVICVIFIELFLQSGLIPGNRNYYLFFLHSMVPISIVDSDGIVTYRSDTAVELDPSAVKLLMQGHDVERTIHGKFLTYESAPTRGGTAIWARDFTAVKQLREELERTHEDIRRQNKILEGEVESRRLLSQLSAREELNVKLEEILTKRIEAIEQSLALLRLSQVPETRIRILARIKFHLGFCKRMGILISAGFESGEVALQTIAKMVSEACSEIVDTSITAAVFTNSSAVIGFDQAVGTLQLADWTLVTSTEMKEADILFTAQDDPFELRMLWSGEGVMERLESEELHSILDRAGFDMRAEEEDTAVRITFVPKEASHVR